MKVCLPWRRRARSIHDVLRESAESPSRKFIALVWEETYAPLRYLASVMPKGPLSFPSRKEGMRWADTQLELRGYYLL